MCLARSWQRPEILELIFDQLSEAIFVYDKALRIVRVNRAAEHLFDMAAEEILGQHCQELFHCSSCDPRCGIRQATDQSSLPTGSVNLHLNNGRQRLVVIRTVQILDDAGAPEGVVATVKDITEEAEPLARQIIAESRAMRDLLGFVRRIALSEAGSILIEGENGTGKDVIAKMLHYQSVRQSEPFLAINCAAIPETLLESELFGHEKGAFTDARAQKRGLFELADKGTLFLDEIAELPLSLQAKLLRVLEEQNFRRLGGVRDIQVDLRIIAATNKNLREAVKKGAFRQDLYYRLNVIQLVVPPLRERRQDILPLSHFFIDQYNYRFNRQIEGLTPDAVTLLLAHDWPGNVRELRNAIERSMILEESTFISAASLPIAVRSSEAAGVPAVGWIASTADGMSLEEQEKRLVIQALNKSAGNQSQAARLLQITRDTLRYKMRKFNLR